jgi:hypothetical protein
VLSEVAGSPIRIVRCDPLTEELSVARCWTSEGGTVIVRTHRSRGGWRTGPEYLLNDYAATILLNSLGGAFCAGLIGADLAAGVHVTEDLGTGPSLDDLLAGSDRTAATAGLVAWARALGELHAATAGLAGEYARLRDGLGSPMPAEHRISLVERPVDAAWTTVAANAGVPVTAAVRADVERLLLSLREPGSLLALSNGDTCPYNSRLLPDGVRFFDFELAGFRHCLLDAAYLRVPFPSCYRWGRLPEPVLAEAESAYRSAMALDDETYLRGLACACGAWAITRAERLGPRSDPLQIARVLAVVTAFVETARTARGLLALAGWFEELACVLWGQDLPEPQLFPVFR